jgi:hypothetical protein
MYENALRSSVSAISVDDLFGGISTMASQITSALRSSVKDIGGDLFRDMQPGGADQMSNVKVKAEIGELKQPAVPPTLRVNAEVVGGLDMPDTSGIEQAGSAIASTLSGFSWPSLPEWVWPTLPAFSWPALPEWRWPPIPAPSWLDRLVIPRPSWLGEMLSWSPQVRLVTGGAPTVPGQLASGTDYWRGGLTWVGERGPELVNLPRGSQVYSNQESRNMAAGGGTVNVTINATVSQPQDWDKVAYEVSRILNRRG